MRARTVLLLTPVAVVALSAGLLSPAGAAPTTTTGSIAGAAVAGNGEATWWDNGMSVHDPYVGTPTTVTLTATARPGAIDVVVQVGPGPVQPYEGRAARSYRLDAFVRVDGTTNSRGTRLAGSVGTTAVAANDRVFPGGVTIHGTLAAVHPGRHTVTLSDLLVDSGVPGDGGFGGTPTGSDTYFNAGTSYASIVTRPTDWPVSQQVTVPADRAAPKVSLTVPKKPTKPKSWKKVRGTATDAGSGVRSVTLKVKTTGVRKQTVTATPAANGSFVAKVGKPKKGKLTITYWAGDNAGNTSARSKLKQRLT